MHIISIITMRIRQIKYAAKFFAIAFVLYCVFRLLQSDQPMKKTPVLITSRDRHVLIRPETWDASSQCWSDYEKYINTDESIRFIPGKTVMMDPRSVRLVCNALRSDIDVLEWGSGGSTLFFSQFVHSWRSLEHDYEWGQTMKKYTSRFANVDLDVIRVPPSYIPYDSHYDGRYDVFKDYVERPALYARRYDLVIVDGRARVACARAVIRNNLLKSADSQVIIHDWERAKYRQVLDEFEVTAEDTVSRRHLVVLRRKRTDFGMLPQPHKPLPGIDRLLYITARRGNTLFDGELKKQQIGRSQTTIVHVSKMPTNRLERLQNHIAAVSSAIRNHDEREDVMFIEDSAAFTMNAQRTQEAFWDLWENEEIGHRWSVVLMTGVANVSTGQTLPTRDKEVVEVTSKRSSLVPSIGYIVRHNYLFEIMMILEQALMEERSSVRQHSPFIPGYWYGFVEPVLMSR